MKGDFFVDAARAVRESYDGTSARSESTRRSVLARAVVAQRRRRRALVLVMPLAAVLAISAAWAAMTGHVPEKVERWLGRRSPHAVAAAPPPATTSPAAPLDPAYPPARLAPVEAVPSAAPVSSPSAPPSPSPEVGAAAPHPRGPRAAAPAPESPGDAETAAFQAAHQLHFVEHDAARALAGWARYLAAYPRGRFAPEARYNRALTLVRLDRFDEARAALAPFADGTAGGYRQREARDLLNALDAMP